MKYTQGKAQSIIYRSKNTILSIVSFGIAIAVGAVFGLKPSIAFIELYISGLIILPIVVTVWLFVFNSGSFRIDEYAVEFSDEGINYLHMTKKDTITWSEYKKYEISGIIKNNLTIYGKARKLTIDLLIFNSKQRKSIISTLSRRAYTK